MSTRLSSVFIESPVLHMSLPDTASPESRCLRTDQSYSASVNASCQNEERSLSKMVTSDEPQLSTQDSKSQDNPAELLSVSTLIYFFISIVQFQEYLYHFDRRNRNFLRGEGREACMKPKKRKKYRKPNWITRGLGVSWEGMDIFWNGSVKAWIFKRFLQ